jgi:DNA-binding response OmpR family regulator
MKIKHLDQLVGGPQIAGYRLQHNDWRHLLVIEGRIIPLTRTEYALTMALLRKAEQVQAPAAPGRMNFFVAIEELLQVAPMSRETLRQHLRNARAKLLPYGITLSAVGLYGYTAVFLRSQHGAERSQRGSAQSQPALALS